MSGALTNSHPFVEEEQRIEDIPSFGIPTQESFYELPEGVVATCVLLSFEDPFEVLAKLFDFIEKTGQSVKHVVINHQTWISMLKAQQSIRNIMSLVNIGLSGYVGCLWSVHVWVSPSVSKDKCHGYSEYATEEFKGAYPQCIEYFNKNLKD